MNTECLICGKTLNYDDTLKPRINELLKFAENMEKLEFSGCAVSLYSSPPEMHGGDTNLWCCALENNMRSEEFFHGETLTEAVQEAVDNLGSWLERNSDKRMVKNTIT
jgi:hypothetical protein